MKRGVYLFIAIAFLGGLLISVAIAEPGDTLLIQNEYTKRMKKPVTFTHKKHTEDYKIGCTECHHTWKKEEGKNPKKCAECHTEKAEGEKLGTKRAYHKQCMDCHKALKKESKPTGPTTKCTECHPSKAQK